MKINDISQKVNLTSSTTKDNTDFGFKDIVKEMKKTKQEQENTEQKHQVERRLEQNWLSNASRIPVIKDEVKKESGITDIVKEAVNISAKDINLLINEITEDETGEGINVEDLEFCLDLIIEIYGKEV